MRRRSISTQIVTPPNLRGRARAHREPRGEGARWTRTIHESCAAGRCSRSQPLLLLLSGSGSAARPARTAARAGRRQRRSRTRALQKLDDSAPQARGAGGRRSRSSSSQPCEEPPRRRRSCSTTRASRPSTAPPSSSSSSRARQRRSSSPVRRASSRSISSGCGRLRRPPVIPDAETAIRSSDRRSSGSASFDHLKGHEVLVRRRRPAPQRLELRRPEEARRSSTRRRTTSPSAWKQGFTGEGTTVGVLDGGTDFGHPDLLGTWKTWIGRPIRARPTTAGTAGRRPSTRTARSQWLVAPEFVDAGLTWYTPDARPKSTLPAEPRTRRRASPGSRSPRARARRGTSPRPDGSTRTPTRFPAAWTKSGTVRLGSHPDDYLLGALRRAAGLPRHRPAHGRRLRHGLRRPRRRLRLLGREAGHEGLAGVVPRHERRRVSPTSPAASSTTSPTARARPATRAVRAASQAFGASRSARLRASCSPGRGDYDPGIEGHGTLTASQRRRPGRHQRPRAVLPATSTVLPAPRPAGHGGKTAAARIPGAVIGGAPDAKLAPFGDIYFSFDFSTQFGYFLSTRNGVDVTSNSYGDVRRRQRRLRRGEPGGRHLALAARRRRRSSRPETARRATARRPRRRRSAGSRSAPRPSSAAPAGTRSRNAEPDRRQRRDGVVEPRPGGDRRAPASTSSPTAPSPRAT